MKPLNNKLEMVQIRLVPDKTLYSQKQISSPWDAVELLSDELKTYDKEVLCVLNMDSSDHVINANIVSMGTVNKSLAMAGEIFKSAILSNASHILLMHNHPSGDVTPSWADKETTKKLELCGKMMGIPVLDHIIIGGQNGLTYSFNLSGLLERGDVNIEKFRKFMSLEENAPYQSDSLGENVWAEKCNRPVSYGQNATLDSHDLNNFMPEPEIDLEP